MIIEATCQECDGDGTILELASCCDIDCMSCYENVECDVIHGEGIVDVYEEQ